MEFLEDGRFITTDESTLIVWDKNNTKLAILDGHSKNITDLKILNNRYLVSSSADATIRIWDINKLKYAKKTIQPQLGRSIVLQNEDILTYYENRINIWDKESGKSIKELIIGVELVPNNEP